MNIFLFCLGVCGTNEFTVLWLGELLGSVLALSGDVCKEAEPCVDIGGVGCVESVPGVFDPNNSVLRTASNALLASLALTELMSLSVDSSSMAEASTVDSSAEPVISDPLVRLGLRKELLGSWPMVKAA